MSLFKRSKKENQSITSKVKNRNERKEKVIAELMEKTGWDRDYAKKQLKEAKDKYGIKNRLYLEYEFYEYKTDEEINAQIKYMNLREKSLKMQRQLRIHRLMDKMGWTYDETLEKLADAKARIGVSGRDYVVHELYRFPEDEQAKALEESKAKKEAAAKEERDKIMARLMAKTGWTKKEAMEKYRATRKRTHCTFSEFYYYELYCRDEAYQDTVFLAYHSRQITAKFDEDVEFMTILYNKAASNRYFAKYLNRAWCINNDITEDEFVERFKHCDRLFYKPLDGHHGDGARPYTVNEENIRDVYKEVSTFSEGVVEEYIVQHPKMNALSPTAVDTVRMVTISSKTQKVYGDENKVVAYASLKMGGETGCVDNLVGGGMVAGVDKETGTIITNAADENDHIFVNHPVTGTQIKGFEIPYFQEAKELVFNAIDELGLVGYLGWDIAILENGPTVVEVNVVPGVVLYSLPYVEEGRGMKDTMMKYL